MKVCSKFYLPIEHNNINIEMSLTGNINGNINLFILIILFYFINLFVFFS